MTLYRIANWEALFETYETKKLSHLKWVPVPNKHDGLGFRRVAAQPNCCELFTAWNLILQVASKGKKATERGMLQRDGRPLAPEDLAIMTGFPSSIFQVAITFFSSPQMGWLESIQQAPTDKTAEPPVKTAEPPASPCLLPAEGKGREGTEWKEGSEGVHPPAHGDEASIPTSEEVATYCATGLGIPKDYCEHYHSQKTINNGWVKNGMLIRWKLDIPRWWAKDRATWMQRRSPQAGKPEHVSVWSMQKQLDAVVVEMKKIEKHGHEDPVAGLVIRSEDRAGYKLLKKRRDELNASIAKGGQ
jgi:hypothetical protein